MPLYEYTCADCGTTSVMLRPMSRADAPAICVHCKSADTSRVISLFAAISKGSDGTTRAVAGAGDGCASCSATSCATCNH